MFNVRGLSRSVTLHRAKFGDIQHGKSKTILKYIETKEKNTQKTLIISFTIVLHLCFVVASVTYPLVKLIELNSLGQKSPRTF